MTTVPARMDLTPHLQMLEPGVRDSPELTGASANSSHVEVSLRLVSLSITGLNRRFLPTALRQSALRLVGAASWGINCPHVQPATQGFA
jgi:hypothetical protein